MNKKKLIEQDPIVVAMSLIEKGKKLNDKEIIEMGQMLLQSHKRSTTKVDLNKEEVPKGDIKLKPLPKKENYTSINYLCNNCGHKFESNKKRKRCPECKKHKLVIEEPEKIKEKPKIEGVTSIFNENSKGKKVKYDEEGNPIGIYSKRVPINLKNASYNRFVDDGKQFNDAENEYLKTKSVTPRTRGKAKRVHVKCSQCGKEEDVPPILGPIRDARSRYLCDRCMSRSARV